jgi:AbrB family looped-hinge helix DNA binding protein
MRVTSKGQVTIPIEVREQLGIMPGDSVEFSVEDGVALLRRAEGPSRGQRLVDRLRGASTSGLSTEEILRLTRG